MRIVLALILVCCAGQSVEGQRFLRTLHPPERPEGEELKFDTNLLPLTNSTISISGTSDANYAPNLVFTPDSNRVFAIFPGSDRLVGWNVVTGEIIADIEVLGNPASVTIAPNETKIGVVSLFINENFGDASNNFQGENIGAINIIDLETLEISTLNLTEVFFSFFNNLVFTADGTRAFVASSLTDELLQIDISSMSEAGPRIKFEGGTRPTPISISPDSSRLAVTLIGSSLLPRNEVSDSVQIIDTETFSIIGNIDPEPYEVPYQGEIVKVLHDFIGTNNLTFSADGQWGIIAEQSRSATAGFREFVDDRVLLINMETKEVIEVFDSGGVAGSSILVPGSELFAVTSATDITFVDYNLLHSWRTQNPVSQFRTSSNPAFHGDQIFIGSPIRDAVVRFKLKYGDLRNVVDVGREFESENSSIPAGALNVSVSPDGQTIAALVFNDNSVDLFQPTKRFVMPQFVQDSQWLTGIALTNISENELEIIGKGYNYVGYPLEDANECEDPENTNEDCENVIDLVNPQTFKMQPGEQVSFTPLGFLDAVQGTTLDNHWLDLDVDNTKLSGLFLALDQKVTRMDGGSLASIEEGSQRQILTHFRVDDPYVSELVILNSSRALSDVDISLIDSDGLIVRTTTVTIAPVGRIARPIRDYFPGSNGIFFTPEFEEGKSHYLLLDSKESLISFIRYYNDTTMAVLEGTSLGEPETQLVNYQIAPQIIAFGNNTSILTVINRSSEESTITLTLHPTNNNLLVNPVEITLQPGALLKQDVAELFNLEYEDNIVSGWVELQSDQVGIFGSVEFQLFNGKAMSTLPFFPKGSKNLVFPHVAQGTGFATGVIALNPGDSTATIDIILRTENASEVATTQLVMSPKTRKSVLVEELFGQPIEQIGGWIDLKSNLPVIAVEMFFSENGEILSAVPGNVLPD